MEEPEGSEPGYNHPHVIVQNNLFNSSKIRTVVVCSLTSYLKRATALGNVLLEEGESGLTKQSVVNVSQVVAVDKRHLQDYIGTLSKRRIRQVLSGIYLLLEPREVEPPFTP